MIKILFVCHGNICRSPMAEFVMKDIAARNNRANDFFIASAATSTEEIGNPVHYGTRRKLAQYGISTEGKYAVQLAKSDYDKYDYIVGMDGNNISNICRMLGKSKDDAKIKKLLDFTDKPGDIADPWYTGNFEDTYEDVLRGCEALFRYVTGNTD